MKRIIIFSLSLLFMSSCNWYQGGEAYEKDYKHHSRYKWEKRTPVKESDYAVILLVDAKRLDYTSCRSLVKTLVKQPASPADAATIGHAWIYLSGLREEQKVVVEGGHSGELGIDQPKYFEGVMNYFKYGCLYPDVEPHRLEENPIKYLWDIQRDGFFQKGNGFHTPTFAAKIALSKEQFEKILDFVDPAKYDYQSYTFIDHQCVSFVSEIAKIVGIELDAKKTIMIDQKLKVGSVDMLLWKDPKYSKLTFYSPDELEKELMRLVEEQKAEDVLDWYLKSIQPKSESKGFSKKVASFPTRFSNWLNYILI